MNCISRLQSCWNIIIILFLHVLHKKCKDNLIHRLNILPQKIFISTTRFPLQSNDVPLHLLQTLTGFIHIAKSEI